MRKEREAKNSEFRANKTFSRHDTISSLKEIYFHWLMHVQ